MSDKCWIKLTRRQAEVVLDILDDDLAAGSASEADRDAVEAARRKVGAALGKHFHSHPAAGEHPDARRAS